MDLVDLDGPQRVGEVRRCFTVATTATLPSTIAGAEQSASAARAARGHRERRSARYSPPATARIGGP